MIDILKTLTYVTRVKLNKLGKVSYQYVPEHGKLGKTRAIVTSILVNFQILLACACHCPLCSATCELIRTSRDSLCASVHSSVMT